MSLSTLASGAAVVVLAATCGLTPAQAARVPSEARVTTQRSSSGWVANTDKISKTANEYVESKQACMKVTFTGKMTYKAKHVTGLAGTATDYWAVKDMKVKDARTTLTLYQYDPGDHACTTHRFKADKVKVTARLRAYSCSYNPSIFVGVPFALGVSFWPSCSDKQAAKYSDSEMHSSSASIYDEDGFVSFGEQEKLNEGATPTWQCYGVRSTVRITTFKKTTVKSTPRKKICLSPQYS